RRTSFSDPTAPSARGWSASFPPSGCATRSRVRNRSNRSGARPVADHLGRGLSADGTVRGLAAVTTDLVEEARRRHGTLPTATAALGRGLTAALLLGGLLKTGERLSLEVSGDGPLGCLL